LFSNNEVPVALEKGDRRLFVVDSMDLVRASDAYYGDMARWLSDKANLDLVASFFKTYPLTAADIAWAESIAPGSQAKENLIAANLSPLEQVIDEIIEEARMGSGLHMVASGKELKFLIEQGLRGGSARGIGAALRRRGARPVFLDPKGNPNVSQVVHTDKGVVRLWLLAETDAKGNNYTNLTQNELKTIYETGTYKPYTTDTEANVVKLRAKTNTEEEV
jgi:hypothetical protein